MKTMKNYGVFAVLATALLAMALVVGCPGPDLGSNGDYTPAAGKGAIKLNLTLDNPNARTAMPSDLVLTTAGLVFSLEFKGDNSNSTPGTAVAATDYAYADLSNPIDLDPGDYTLDIIVYLTTSTGAGADPVAVGSEDFAITATGLSTLHVVLGPIADGTGSGTFAWNINFSAVSDLDTAEMTVTTIAGGSTSITGTDVKATPVNATGVSLTSGYYYVDFTLVVDDSTNPAITRHFRHVLHIYENQESTFTYVFTDDHFVSYTVSKASLDEVTVSYEAGQFPPTFALSGANFAGNGLLVTTPIVLDTAGDQVIITIDNADDVDTLGNPYTSIAWWCDGAAIPAGLISNGGGVTGDTLTLTYNAITAPGALFATKRGGFQILVIGTIGGAPHSTEIFFEIQ